MKKNDTVFIPFSKYSSIGGPSTFMSNLRAYLDRTGFAYSDTATHAGAVFFPVSYPVAELDCFKTRGVKIIQRLDGVYYPQKCSEYYLRRNTDIRKIYRQYADHIVFQSEYSRKQCGEMFGDVPPGSYSIIVNGADAHLFFPEKKDLVRPDVVSFVTTGAFRSIDMIEPIVRALDSLRGVFDFRLIAVGPIMNPDLAHFFERPYITVTGEKSPTETAAFVRQSDMYLHTQLNSSCPNAVVEAVSAGVPVVGFDSGAAAELCFFNRQLLVYVSAAIFQEYADVSPERLAEKIKKCLRDYPQYKKLALDHSNCYRFDACGERYAALFRAIVSSGRLSLSCRLKNAVMSLLEKPARYWLDHSSDYTCKQVILRQINTRAQRAKPADALEYLFEIDNSLYTFEGREAVRYGNGLHTKHRHTRYHNFFLNNIPAGSRVLDIGCGNGALAADIADAVEGVFVHAIDMSHDNIAVALAHHDRKNISYACGDALRDLPEEHFDVIVLSNVLEHIEHRVDFLLHLKQRFRPAAFLIRIPVFERDWRVPLKKELGVDYRLDSTHYIEYTREQFNDEISAAGLYAERVIINWGELWAVVRSKQA